VYYLRYFGYSHPLVKRFLNEEDLKQVLLHMAEFDTILFSWKKESDLVVYTDATEVKLAAIVGSEVAIAFKTYLSEKPFYRLVCC
jgi:hypothetical protein